MAGNLRHKLGRFALLVLLTMAPALASNAPVSNAASPDELTDYDWQAILLLKLSLDTTWPQTVTNGDMRVINVCATGNSSGFTNALEKFAPRAELNKKLKLSINNIADNSFSGCNIVYIPRGKANYKQIISAAKKAPVMTMAPIENFAASGGVIEFILNETSATNSINNKVSVTFKVNNTAAMENGLNIGTDTLGSALEVTE